MRKAAIRGRVRRSDGLGLRRAGAHPRAQSRQSSLYHLAGAAGSLRCSRRRADWLAARALLGWPDGARLAVRIWRPCCDNSAACFTEWDVLAADIARYLNRVVHVWRAGIRLRGSHCARLLGGRSTRSMQRIMTAANTLMLACSAQSQWKVAWRAVRSVGRA